MGRKKKFIDKKKSATFQLLARDSSDPNYDAGPASDRIFVRVDNNPYAVDSFDDENTDNVSGHGADDPSSIFADASDDKDEDGDWAFGEPSQSVPRNGVPRPGLPDHVRREILELGFPDDGYNYLVHMREIKNTGGGSAFYHNSKAKLDQLPHDVKAYDASRVHIREVNDEPVDKSIYNVAAKTVGVRVQKAADPEVAALLDDSDLSRFGSDFEELEEDFLIQANLPDEGEDVVIDKKLNLVEKPEVLKEENNEADDHPSNLVESSGYDISESVDACDEKTRVRNLLDEQFDLLVLNEYGTDSEDDYGGSLAEEHASLAQKLSDTLKDHVMDDLELEDKYKSPADVLRCNGKLENTELLDSAADVIKRCAEYAERYEIEDEDEDKSMVFLQESSSESEDWDCETIISTYSNLDNHPGKIDAPEITRKKKLAETFSKALSTTIPVITLRGKEKLPVDFLPGARKATKEKVKGLNSLSTEPLKGRQNGQETKEEKKERKAAVKEERREARRMKKEMKGLYRFEAKRAQKAAAVSAPSSIHLM
ncbi:uncharacterized protein LOC131167863 [Malania oleifera]|uniref:uncharacterized protein LOC131167863 n=1 Tax=Malania oleifera TaxID=397392 RepID=UPI0025AE1B3A|nr:uncharacterized protein LOC131167863 [Malania oleifera]